MKFIANHQKRMNSITNETNDYYIENFWSLDILDLKNYGPENNRSYRYVLVVVNNFSKFRWKIALKNKSAQTMKDS